MLTVLTLTMSAGQVVAGEPRGTVAERSAVDRSAAAQQSAEYGSANAAANDVEQGVAVVDRTTGSLVADQLGDRVYNSESILKLFTAAFYLVQAAGDPDPELIEQLRTLITVSDNGIQTELWSYDIIPAIAERYGLTDTSNGPYASSQSWGSDRTTAKDQVQFLYRMSLDPMVGPLLMSWMAAVEPTAADGFDQEFGLAALTGDHGAKQGWSDPGWSPANLHSVGWTDRYFVAILQNSPTATYATMRATSTTTARSLAALGGAAGTAGAAARSVADPAVGGSSKRDTRSEFDLVIRNAYCTADIKRSIGVGWIAAPRSAAVAC